MATNSTKRTFEEAVRLVTGPDADKLKQKHTELIDRVLIDDAVDELGRAALWLTTEQLQTQKSPRGFAVAFRKALLSMYTLGLVTGLEMENSDGD